MPGLELRRTGRGVAVDLGTMYVYQEPGERAWVSIPAVKIGMWADDAPREIEQLIAQALDLNRGDRAADHPSPGRRRAGRAPGRWLTNPRPKGEHPTVSVRKERD